MSLHPQIKKSWIEAQKKADFPVNALGMRIDPKDTQTLAAWEREGISQFMPQKPEPHPAG